MTRDGVQHDLNVKPMVSIIMPTFNAESFVEEALQSLLGQTYNSFELIIIDDESSDSTLKIVEALKARDKRIKCFSIRKSGASAARNLGLSIAQGKYVIFLDADDLFHHELLEACVSISEKSSADFTIFCFTVWNMLTGDKKRSRDFSHSQSLGELGFKLSSMNPEPWNKFYRRDFLLKNQLVFQNISTCNDIFFTKSAMLFAKNIACLDRDLLTYRISKTSTSANRYKNALNVFEAGQLLIEFIHQNHLTYDQDDFYKMMMSFICHEFKSFPPNENKISFIVAVFDFLPRRYWKKIKLKLSRVLLKYIIGRNCRQIMNEILLMMKY